MSNKDFVPGDLYVLHVYIAFSFDEWDSVEGDKGCVLLDGDVVTFLSKGPAIHFEGEITYKFMSRRGLVMRTVKDDFWYWDSFEKIS